MPMEIQTYHPRKSPFLVSWVAVVVTLAVMVILVVVGLAAYFALNFERLALILSGAL